MVEAENGVEVAMRYDDFGIGYPRQPGLYINFDLRHVTGQGYSFTLSR